MAQLPVFLLLFWKANNIVFFLSSFPSTGFTQCHKNLPAAAMVQAAALA